MGRKKLATFSSVFIFSVLTCLLISVSFANANFTPLPPLPTPIYIKSDGSVDPPTAPIQKTGDTYKLTCNINNTVVIQRSNLVLDGDGYTITKPSVNTSDLMIPQDWLPGIRVADVSNVKIVNFSFEGCITGIIVDNSTNITIFHNLFRETLTGMVVYRSSYVEVVGNNLFLKKQTFATGITFQPSSGSQHVRIESNLIVGNSKEVPNYDMQPEEYGMWGGFENSVVTKNTITNVSGIALYNIGAKNCIAHNNFENNTHGILINGLYTWCNNTIYGNNFNNNYENAVNGYVRNWPVDFWCNCSIGNYWSDYTGEDKDSDGLGDTPYIIQLTYEDHHQQKTVEQGRDTYPAMKPFDIPVFNVELPQHSTPISTTSTNLTSSPSDATKDDWGTTSFSTAMAGAIMIAIVIIIFATVKNRH